MRSPLFSCFVALGAFALVMLTATRARAQEFYVAPYVQHATTSEAWVLWETDGGEESSVEWGGAETLGATATGTVQPSDGTRRFHEVALGPLTPSTRYYYRVRTGSLLGPVAHFVTAPLPETKPSFRFVAFSDTQIDQHNPNTFRRVVSEGMLPWLAEQSRGNTDPSEQIAFALVVGDLVEDGTDFPSWRAQFFDPVAALTAFVPVYATIGNHENDSPNYYRYFHQPPNGSAKAPEQWWAMTYGDVRFVSLNSNILLLEGEQAAFLDRELDTACKDEGIDFLVVQMHHAHRSEYWPDGEQPMSRQVVARLDRFENECRKPVVHLHGHTHAYARGASHTARHVWLNVATAGGNIDYADEYDDRVDVDEISVSQDDWGFVVVDVTASPTPSLSIQRVSVGNERVARHNEVRDAFTLRRGGDAPATPLGAMPRGIVRPECATLKAGPFADPKGLVHEATHWQVSVSCDDFSSLVFERHRQRENWFGGVDLQRGDDLTDEPASGLEEGTAYCWRARYRNADLVWSEWSPPMAFRFAADGASSCVDERRVDADGSSGDGCRASSTRPAPPPWAVGLVVAALALRRRSR